MMNERIRLAVEVLGLVWVAPQAFHYRAAAVAANAPESLRALLIWAIQSAGVRAALVEYWSAVVQERRSNGAGLSAMVEVLHDPDVFEARHAEEVRATLRDVILPRSQEEPDLVAFAEEVWKPQIDDATVQAMWRGVLSTNSLQGAQSLAERADVNRLDLMELFGGSVGMESGAFLASLLTDEKLALTLDEVAASSTRAMLKPLYLLVQEHFNRHGSGDGRVRRLFDWVEDGLLRAVYGIDALPKMLLPKLLELAIEADEPLRPEAIQLVYQTAEDLEPELLARLIKRGFPVKNPAPSARDIAGGKEYLLSRVGGAGCVPVVRAMTAQQLKDFVWSQGGFVQVVRQHAQNWGQVVLILDSSVRSGERRRREGSVLDDNLITALHGAGFDLSAKRPPWEGAQEGRLLHDQYYDSTQTERFIFTALHALGVYPKDIRLDGFGPLHFAAYAGDVKAIERLVSMGWDVDDRSSLKHVRVMVGNARSSELGWTPLMIAVKSGEAGAVRALLDLGADVAIKSPGNHTAMKLAKDEETKRLLKAARMGAKISSAMDVDDGIETSPKLSDAGIL